MINKANEEAEKAAERAVQLLLEKEAAQNKLLGIASKVIAAAKEQTKELDKQRVALGNTTGLFGQFNQQLTDSTAAAARFGKGTAAVLKREGAKVYISDINKEGGEKVAQELGVHFLEHDVTDGNGNFEIKVTPTGGNDTTQTTPLSIGQRDVTFDVNDSSNTSEDGSFDISGGAFNFTGRTFKINDLTIEDDSTSSLTELKTTSNDIEIVNSDGNKIKIDANGVNIGLNNTTNNSDVFSVGTTFTVDTSGNVDASGNIVVGGTGKFGNALIDGSSDAVFGFNNYISSISINTTGSNYNENDSIEEKINIMKTKIILPKILV